MNLETDYILELDPDSVNSRGNTYRSLTDTYQIPLFTDRYEEQYEQMRQDEQAEAGKLSESVFCGMQMQEDETEVIGVLFMESVQEMPQENSGNQAAKSVLPAGISFGILVFGLLALIEIWGYRKRKKKYDDRNYN